MTMHSFSFKRIYFAVFLIIFLIAFGFFPEKAEGEHTIKLVGSKQHKQMCEMLKTSLEERFKIQLLILPLDEFVDVVVKNETDLFVISFSEIHYIMRITALNLAVKGSALASADVAEKIYLTTLPKTEIKNIGDLGDKLLEKPISLGPKYSPTEAHANDSIKATRRVNGNINFSCEKKGGNIKCQNNRFDEQTEMLLRGEVKAFYVTGEGFIPSVMEVAETNWLELVAIPEIIVHEMNNISMINKYIPTIIDLKDYNSGDKKVPTAGIPAAVAATDRVDNETVALITEILLEKNPFINIDYLPMALTAIRSYMRIHPVSLYIFRKSEIKLKN